jgi:hypothetical protein
MVEVARKLCPEYVDELELRILTRSAHGSNRGLTSILL